MINHSIENLNKINNTNIFNKGFTTIDEYRLYCESVPINKRLLKILSFYYQKRKFKEIQSYEFEDNKEWCNIFKDFKWFLTFRTSKDSWNGDKPKFEYSLVEKEISWFVYIKFYINESNKIKPLVVGKSGSKNVNSSGSDLSFSTHNSHGKARQFLIDNNLEWYVNGILILLCDTESNTLSLEKEIKNNFGLFTS